MSSQRQSTGIRPQSVLFWVFLCISIPLMIFLVLFASGYRLDPSSGQVVVSAALAIETEPKDVTVLLNGEIQPSHTPYIDTFEAGAYTIELQKDGFLPWKKQLTFEEGKSILFPNVLLFRNQKPIVSSVQDLVKKEDVEVLPEVYHSYYANLGWDDPATLLFVQGPQDLLIDPAQQVSYVINDISTYTPDHRIESAVIDAAWNKDGVLLYATEFELWLFNPAFNEYVLLTRRATPITGVEWHPEGGYIFFTDTNGVYALEIDPRDQRQLWQLADTVAPIQLSVSAKGDELQFFSNYQWMKLSLFK